MAKIIELIDGVPIASDQGNIAFCSVLLIEGEDADGVTRRILVDSAHVGRRLMLVDALAEHGLSTLDVDYVLCTHAHWDHVQNSDLFTEATMLIDADERRYAHNPSVDDWATPSWTGYILEQLKTEEVGDGHEIIPGVAIIGLPGHTVGSIGVCVETDRGMAVATSDALHFGPVALSGVNPLVFWDEKQASDSIRRVIEKADLIYPGHDMPFRISSDGQLDYQRDPSMVVAGMTPSVADLGNVMPVMMMPDRSSLASTKSWKTDGERRINEVVTRPYAHGVHPVTSDGWDRG